MLARAASNIKIGHVVRAIDGPLAPIACASRSAYEPCGDCKSVKACAVRFTMVKVRDAVSEILDQMTVADMVAISEGRNVTQWSADTDPWRQAANADRGSAHNIILARLGGANPGCGYAGPRRTLHLSATAFR